MPESFVVSIADKQDNVIQNAVCRSTKELSTFLAHLNRDKYVIVNILTLPGGIIKDYKEFCIKEDNLETGDKEKKEK